MDMHIVKGKRVGELQDIYHKNSISVPKIIKKERVKGCVGKPKVLLQVLWEHVSVDTYCWERANTLPVSSPLGK